MSQVLTLSRGLSLFIAELTGVYFTGGSLNPARSFAPAVVLHRFEVTHWVYWLGPLLGAALASAFYKLIKKLEYETANPNQDAHESPMKMNKADKNGAGNMADENAPKNLARDVEKGEP